LDACANGSTPFGRRQQVDIASEDSAGVDQGRKMQGAKARHQQLNISGGTEGAFLPEGKNARRRGSFVWNRLM
jgi:hypothetical protein